MNAGGVLNTCKSDAHGSFGSGVSGERASNTWVTCRILGDKLGKSGLIPDRTHGCMVVGGKCAFCEGCVWCVWGLRSISWTVG